MASLGCLGRRFPRHGQVASSANLQPDSSSSLCFPYVDLEAVVSLNWVLSDIVARGQIDFSIQVSCLEREEVK